jgi:hypothetical protein
MTMSSQRSGDISTRSVPSRHRTIRLQSQGVHHSGAGKKAAIGDQETYSDWTVQEQRHYLGILSRRVWDIEDELARTRTERARLMNSLQTNLKQTGAAHPFSD